LTEPSYRREAIISLEPVEVAFPDSAVGEGRASSLAQGPLACEHDRALHVRQREYAIGEEADIGNIELSYEYLAHICGVAAVQ